MVKPWTSVTEPVAVRVRAVAAIVEPERVSIAPIQPRPRVEPAL
jgi:hypothetical protein